MANDTYDVFVSYSRADWRHAREIDAVLRHKGLRPFFDRRNLAPGLPWVRALEQVIGAAKAAIVLIGPGGFGNTQQYERELALVRQARDPAFRVVPIVLPETRTDRPFDFTQVLTWIDFSDVAKVSDAPDELERLLSAVCGETMPGQEAREAVCPWRGLDAFREEDSAFFFGRGSVDDPESPIGQLVSKIHEHPFVMVVGRSGSGKSSLVFAGLIPALRRERERFWTVLSFRPGVEPLQAIAEAFNPRAADEGAVTYARKINDETEALRGGGQHLLASMIQQYLQRAEGKPDRLLLYIDQWEELYARRDGERATQHVADVSRFIDLLLNAARTAPVTIIGTVRADFYDPLIGHPEVRALLPNRQILLGSMPRAGLERTIVEPARKVGLAFDPPSLVQHILDEAGDDEGMLPLLQYALKESWAMRRGYTITADCYARSGGVREAIRMTAERTFEALSEGDQRVARQLFLRLVTPGEGQEDTRARSAMPSEPTQRRIVEQFAGPRTRLLVTGWDRAARPTVEVAHEALIRTWPRLRKWIDASREKLRARAVVVQAMREWEQNGQRDDLLLPAGFQLERARALLADPGDLTLDDLKEFIARSSAREDAEREQRESARAREKVRVAQIKESIKFESRAIAIIADAIRLPRSLSGAADSLAMALKKPPNLPNIKEYVELLYNGLGELRERRRILIPGDFEKQVFALSFAPAGKLLAAAVPGNLLFYDSDNGELVHSEKIASGWVVALRWSPDGKRIYVGTSPVARILAACSIEKLREYFPDCGDEKWEAVNIGSEEYPAGAGAWSHDSRWIIVAGWQRRASLWDASEGQFKWVLRDDRLEGNPLDCSFSDVAGSTDGKRIALAAVSGKIYILGLREVVWVNFAPKPG